MKTLSDLIASIPDAPPEHERFRMGKRGLEFRGHTGGWTPIKDALAIVLNFPPKSDSTTKKTWLRLLEDAANAAIVAYERMTRENGTMSMACRDGSQGYWEWTHWIAGVKLAAKGVDDE